MLDEGQGYDGGVAAEGAIVVASVGRTKARRVATVHGSHYDSNSRGRIYRGGIGGAGIAPGTALATTAQALLLWNPDSSGVNLNVLNFAHAFVGGTFGLGFWVLGNYSTLNPKTNVAPGGTVSVPQGANGAVGVGKGLLFNAATCTAAPIFGETLGDWEGVLDGTGATQVGSIRNHKFDGDCIVIPGTAVVFTYVGGAGTAPKVAVSCRWEEVPI
jgi:hypothetical protein